MRPMTTPSSFRISRRPSISARSNVAAPAFLVAPVLCEAAQVRVQRLDTVAVLQPAPDGGLVAPVDLRDGSWIVELNVSAGDRTPWHEMERILLREGQTR